VLLGARGGLRLAEALALTWDDVHLTASPATLHVRNGKGGRDRTVLLVPELTDALEALRCATGKRTETAGEQGTDHVLPYRSAERARERLRRLQQRANIPTVNGRAIHSLRHSAGTAVYAATGDLIAVQAWLGHATIATSRGYVHRAHRATLATVAEALPRIKKHDEPATTTSTSRRHSTAAIDSRKGTSGQPAKPCSTHETFPDHNGG
jgi:integrase